MITRLGATLAILLALVIASPAARATAAAGEIMAEAGGMKVKVSTRPERPTTGGKTVYTVRLEDAAGMPVAGAKVTLSGRMADGMSVVAPLRAVGEAGTYRGEVLYTMAGRWDLAVRVTRGSERFQVSLVEEIGR